ncbi:hypothetical protein GCM10007047_10630 [Cerasicoccus arenae]|uniref:Uncharacterized protein n=1 Tax=Cerasicoccus arenae TaxID=424488 RepID=A0A8J3GDH6_9BACT|nr:hypothetical protein GCM10007047_10630 [Cerasicoccus arenae]
MWGIPWICESATNEASLSDINRVWPKAKKNVVFPADVGDLQHFFEAATTKMVFGILPYD